MLNFDNGDLKKSTLCEQVADEIERAIIVRGVDSERLPSEMALAQQFNVSRTIIRESLKVLTARGLVSSKVGGGAFITKPSSEDISKMFMRIILMEKISDDEVYQIRVILETAAARDAALRFTDEDFALLSSQVDAMEQNMKNFDIRIEKDIEFHVLLGRLSGNRLLALIIESMTDILRNFIKRGLFVSGGNEDGIYRHRMILDALKTRNPEEVEKVVREHLLHSKHNVDIQQSVQKTDLLID